MVMRLGLVSFIKSLATGKRLATDNVGLARVQSFFNGTDAGLGDSFSHAATAAGVAIMVSNSIGVKRPSAA